MLWQETREINPFVPCERANKTWGKPSLRVFNRNDTTEFDRGGNFGTAKRTLRDGDFQFVVGDNCWDLKKTQVNAKTIPQIKNSALQSPLPGGG